MEKCNMESKYLSHLEEARSVVGYPQYKVTRNGRSYNAASGAPLSLYTKYNGYIHVTLKVKRESFPKLVHLIVLVAFKGGPPQDGRVYTCDHIDKVRHNNHIDNLRWATAVEQTQNRNITLGKGRPACFRSVLTTDEKGNVCVYRRLADAMAIVAPHLHPANCTVYKALKVDGGEAYGYIWEYLPPPLGTYKDIPPRIIDGSKGYKVLEIGYVMTPTGRVYNGTLGEGREYPMININKHEYRVHRLVAAVFVPNPDHLPVVNHRNGIKTDNNASNLEWVTHRQNTQHAVDMGLCPKAECKPVEQYHIQDDTVIARHESVNEAARSVGKPTSDIIACCKGRQKTAYGFKWCYADG